MLRRILQSPATYFVLAGLLVLLAIASQFEVRLPTQPKGSPADLARLRERDDVNVLFILIDTLRADRLGAYGYPRDTSPWMDALAHFGVRFERVVSQSTWTKASMASLWTATHPRRNGVLRWGHGLPAEAPMPAEIFRDAGIRTAAVFRNGWVAPNFGFAQGFESYVRPASQKAVKMRRRTRAHERLEGSDEDVTLPAIEFMRTYADQRFLLYLHYMDVHQYTYDEESARFGNSYSDGYDNAIRWTDRNVAALLAQLDALELRDKTLVVIASDHGEEFLEHGNEGHAKALYRETTEVPLILGLPFRLEPGIVVPSVVQNVDIWPTILDLLGLPPLQGADGRSLVPLIEAAAGMGDEAGAGLAFAQLDRRWGQPDEPSLPLLAVTEGRYRLIVPLNEGESAGKLELYDHGDDPNEQRNRVEDLPEVKARLEAHLAEYLGRPAASWGTPLEVEIDDLEMGQLRALGYVVR
jgi:arylsulfatase A-like enzyme